MEDRRQEFPGDSTKRWPALRSAPPSSQRSVIVKWTTNRKDTVDIDEEGNDISNRSIIEITGELAGE